MERYHVGLDVSKDATETCVRRSDGAVERVCETATGPDAICAALENLGNGLERVILGTGRMASILTGARKPRILLRGAGWVSGAFRSDFR